jgi:type IV secretion system protein VirB4
LRRLSAFRRQFRSVDDDGALFDRMGDWDADGSFGWLFSGGRPSTICLLTRR